MHQQYAQPGPSTHPPYGYTAAAPPPYPMPPSRMMNSSPGPVYYQNYNYQTHYQPSHTPPPMPLPPSQGHPHYHHNYPPPPPPPQQLPLPPQRFIPNQHFLPRHHQVPPSHRPFPPTPPSVQSLSPAAYSKPVLLPHSSPALHASAPVFQPQHLFPPPIPAQILPAPSKAVSIVKPASPPPPQEIKSPEQPQIRILHSDNEPKPPPTYSISSRPSRPSDALGVTISPAACPPPNVILFAQPPPPTTPKPKRTPVLRQQQPQRLPSRNKTPVFSTASTTAETTPTVSSVPTPTPGSPSSSSTSISPPMTPVSLKRETVHTADDDAIPPTLSTISPITLTQEKLQAVSEPEPPSPVIPTDDKAPPSVPKPLIPPPLKKSFASLLRSPSSPSSSSIPSASSSNKTPLPTSPQVGVSIPGAAVLSTGMLSPTTFKRPADIQQLLVSSPSIMMDVGGERGHQHIRPRGLVNTGNMCFANSVLQALIYSPPFWNFFTALGKFIGSGPVAGVQREGKRATPLTDATVRLLKEFTYPPASLSPRAKSKMAKDADDQDSNDAGGRQKQLGDSFVPSYVYAAMKEKKRFDSMRSGHQEDAEEFLGFYLDTLHEELLTMISYLPLPSPTPNPHILTSPSPSTGDEETHEESPNSADGWLEVGKKNRMVVTRTTKSVDSPITRIFTGKYRSVLRVPGGGKDSATVEDLRPMQLDIQPANVNTIEDALRNFITPDIVQLHSSTRGGPAIEATKQAFVEALPPILILHLKRFIYDAESGGAGKVGKRVTYGPELEISNDIMAPSRRTPQVIKYKLYGVVYHHGSSASGGHYTIDILHPNPKNVDFAENTHNDDTRTAGGEGWIRIDDENIINLRENEVFGMGGKKKDSASEGEQQKSAYLLFYRRLVGGASQSARM